MRWAPPVAAWMVLSGIYWSFPVEFFGDMACTLTTAERVLFRGTWYLDGIANLPDWPIQRDNDRPPRHVALPGCAILCVPLVAATNLFGYSTTNFTGRWLAERECELQRIIAAMVSSATVVVIYTIVRTWLSPVAALAVGWVLAFGTQVTSTLSRAMYSQTWTTLLLAVGLLYVLRARPLIATTFFATACLCRPTAVVPLLVLLAWIAWRGEWRTFCACFGLASLLGICLGIWCLTVQGTLVPFYICSQFDYQEVSVVSPRYLFGTLLAPSRGLFICVPISGWVLLRGMRRWELTWLPAIWILIHIAASIAVAGWYGMGCFGSRYTAELVVPFSVLAAVAVARVQSRAYEFAAILTLSALSVGINTIGATSERSKKWNERLVDYHTAVEAAWDWTDPQWLRPFCGDRE